MRHFTVGVRPHDSALQQVQRPLEFLRGLCCSCSCCCWFCCSFCGSGWKIRMSRGAKHRTNYTTVQHRRTPQRKCTLQAPASRLSPAKSGHNIMAGIRSVPQVAHHIQPSRHPTPSARSASSCAATSSASHPRAVHAPIVPWFHNSIVGLVITEATMQNRSLLNRRSIEAH